MRNFDSLVLASLNPDKLAEFAALFAKHKIKISSPEAYIRNAKFLQTVETHAEGTTYLMNAQRKCHPTYMAAKVPTLADDSGLEIDALQGKPGIHSAHFAADKRTGEDQAAANRRKVLEALKGSSNRKARFRCILVFMVEGVQIKAEGVCEGKIAEQEIGTLGFGYDKIFIPDGGNGHTFGQISSEQKNAMSHRAAAVQDLMRLLHERNIQFVRP
jgi:XTP/dITP diphosphohydrolase